MAARAIFQSEDAPRLVDEEMAEVGQMGVEEIEQALGDLGKLGFSMR